MVSACMFADAAGAAGIDFVPLGTEEDFLKIAHDRRIWKLGVGTKLVLDHAVEWSKGYLEAVEKIDGVDLMMSPLTAMGARMAREKLGIPLITVHLQPMVFMSAYDTPLVHPCLGWFGALPVGVKRFLFSLPNLVDVLALPRIRKICAMHGINPPRSIWRDWWNSPDGVLVLFPEWFAKPQPDWPVNVLQWDFPMEDMGVEIGMSAELKAFLKAGEEVVVFTPGSANVQAERFFESATEAVRALGLRAVFITRMALTVPDDMKGEILVQDFIPFGKVLPFASAFVHHGGIGTMAQGFRAGVPQLVMAMAHDQPDNGNRLEKMGAGIMLSPSSFSAARVTKELGKLLRDPIYKENAVACASKFMPAKDPVAVALWIEGKMKEDRSK